MPDQGSATYAGLTNLRHAEITVSRGVTPSIAKLEVVTREVLVPAIGTLTFSYGASSRAFTECLPFTGHLRHKRHKDKAGFYWSLQVLDRRWKWWLTPPISGRYNYRSADGSVDAKDKKNPRELATLLLNALGEAGFDVSQLPDNVWPRINWKETPPALALAELCEYCACEVTGGEVGAVVIVSLGTGSDLPAGGSPGFLAHQHFRIVPATRPSTVTVRCGPTVYQSKLRLEAVGQDTDSIKRIDDLSYKPTAWASESPFTFNSISDAANRARAFASVWRWHRVKEQVSGTLQDFGSATVINDITQYLLTPSLVQKIEDLQGYDKLAAAYVEGKWWPYSDKTQSLATTTRYHGPWSLNADRQTVEFPRPIFGLSASGVIEAPTLALVCGYHAKDSSGKVEAVEKSAAIAGGNGRTLTLLRPEIFGTIIANYNAVDQFTGTTSTIATAEAEAQVYADRFKTALQDFEQEDVEWLGLEAGAVLTGKIVQYKLSVGKNEQFKTRASRGFEFDTFTKSQQERRRVEILTHLRSMELLAR